MKAGVAKVDITPEAGGTIGGHLVDVRSAGVHDPLYAKTFISEAKRAEYKDYFHRHADLCRELRRTQGSVQAVVQAAAIGDIALVGVSGELFTELGLSIHEKSPFAHTLVVTHANDVVGYIPSAKGYEDGGYQPFNTIVGRGSGEIVVAAAERLLKSLVVEGTTSPVRPR